MYNSIIGILSITNLISVLYYYDEYKYKNGYKLKLKDRNKSYDELLTQYHKSKQDLEELAIKMKNNDLTDIDKYINYGCPKCYKNDNLVKNMETYIWGPYDCCKTCFRCRNCGDKKFT